MRPGGRVVSIKFVCPSCGHTHWGSGNMDRPFVEWFGMCNNLGCSFRWSRKDDWRYFQITLRPTRAEYVKYSAMQKREHKASLRRSRKVAG